MIVLRALLDLGAYFVGMKVYSSCSSHIKLMAIIIFPSFVNKIQSDYWTVCRYLPTVSLSLLSQESN